MQTSPLVKSVLILVLLILSFGILYLAKPVLAPLAIAGVLAMLFLPFSMWMEKRGISRSLASLVCIVSFILILGGIVLLLIWQITNISSDITQIKEKVSHAISQIQKFISDTFGISRLKQNKMIEGSPSSDTGVLSTVVKGVMGSLLSVIVNLILIVVYMFMLLYFRTRIKNFILKVVPSGQEPKTKNILSQSANVVQHYLLGLAMLIGTLWVMYGIGFSIVGVKSPLLFAIICGLLEIIPFVGNITGSSLTVVMALAQGGGISMAFGVLITYTLVQSIQFYIISPLLLGGEVNVNPLFTLLILFIGEMVWGIPGMILAIPMLGIVKIICDNVEPLKPYGYLIGQEKKNGGKALGERIKKWFSRK